MPTLPPISGLDVVKFLSSLGYETLRQRGSHIRLRKQTALGEHNLTVPAHKELVKGLSMTS